MTKFNFETSVIISGVGLFITVLTLGYFLAQNRGPSHSDLISGQTGPIPVHTEPYQENMARGQLWDLYNNCSMLWSNENREEHCSIKKVSQWPYFFSLDPPDWSLDQGIVMVKIRSGEADSFSATAQHGNSPIIWEVNSEGMVRCTNFSASECEARTHVPREEVLDEVREWTGLDITKDDSIRGIEIDEDGNPVAIR